MRRAGTALAFLASATALALGCPGPRSRAVSAPHEMPWPDAAPALEDPIPAEADAGADGTGPVATADAS